MEVMTMIIVMVVVIMTMGSDGIKTPRQRRVIAPSRNTLVVTTMVITEVQVVDKVQCTCNGADYENGHDGADDNCDGKHSPCCHIQRKAWLLVIILSRRC